MATQSDLTNIFSLPEFDDHASVSFLQDHSAGLRAFVAIHRTRKTSPSFGATRILPYTSNLEAIKDALRLSKMMSYKAALAGLPCGGAKGVIIQPEGEVSDEQKKKIFESYANRINLFGGNFITGTDVGISQEDLVVMKEKTDYLIGFSGEAAGLTALGILYAINAVCRSLFRADTIAGRTFAIQGLGKVGFGLLELLYLEAKTIYISDINTSRAEEVKKKYPHVEVIPPHEIHKQVADMYCPCALSGVLNSQSISELNCSAIVGGANNQLSSEEIGVEIYHKGIVYVPDYVANAGGLITVYDEYEHGIFNRDRALEKIKKIAQTTKKIILASRQKKKPTNYVANDLAEQIFTS